MKRCALLLSCMFGLLLPAAACADSLVLDWPALLPGLTDTYTPNSANICTSGRIQCIDSVINEMQRRFAPLAQSCDHNALFALLYLRVTQTYRQEVGANPSFFQDTNFVNHEDPVFAYRYFFDLSEAEMAVALDVARGTVKSRLSRALGRMRVLMGEPVRDD